MSLAPQPGSGPGFIEELVAAQLPLWREARFAGEVLALHASRVFYGFNVPRGNGAAVLLVPGFLLPDAYLGEMRFWLRRIGYRACVSGIRLNAECPNLLIDRHLKPALDQAATATGGARVHLIGHSLGGVMARALAVLRPERVASVTTLASPFRGAVAHRSVLFAIQSLRRRILRKHGAEVLPECFTGRCTCDFAQALRRDIPPSVQQTAVYTRGDGVVDWRCCVTGDSSADFEVRGTHLGLAFNPAVYLLLAQRLRLSNAERK